MRVLFTPNAWDDYQWWQAHDQKTLLRLNTIIEDVRRHSFVGIGKPEPLKGNLKSWWSRRISREHRLVYRVSGEKDDQRVEIAQCRFHY